MERRKFLGDIKNASIFALVVSIIYFIIILTTFGKLNTTDNFETILSYTGIISYGGTGYAYECNLFVIGLIIYFSMVLMKLIFHKCNMKVPQIIFIATFALTSIWYFSNLNLGIFSRENGIYLNTILYGTKNLLNGLYTLIFAVFLYLLFYKNNRILLKPLIIISIIKFIHSILVIIAILGYSMYFYNYIACMGLALLVLSIIPYFLFYKDESSIINYQKNTNSKIRLSEIFIFIFVIGIFLTIILLRKYVFTAEKHIDKLFASLPSSFDKTRDNYSSKAIQGGKKRITFRIHNSLYISSESNGMVQLFKKDGRGSSFGMLVLVSRGNDFVGLRVKSLKAAKYNFVYNNIKYYYDYSDDGSEILILTKLDNGYYYGINISKKTLATMTVEELEGLLYITSIDK